MSKIQKVTKRDVEKAQEFADKRLDTDLYKSRGGFKRSDIVVGALAEIGVYKFLKKQGFNPSKPDFNIYEAKGKSYDADLVDGVRHFHVKGQSMKSVKRYGESWLMQRYDPILNNPKPSHYVVMCTVDLETNEVHIHGFPSVKSLLAFDAIGECTVPSFRRTKVAIYKDDVDALLSHNARWGILRRV